MKLFAVVTLLLLALTASAQTPFTTGDVLVLEPFGWFDFYYPPTVTVVDANGNVKAALPRTLPFDNMLLAQAPDLLWSSDSSGVLLSRDGATLAGRFLTSLQLDRLAGIAPLRSGNLLVAEAARSLVPGFVELTQSGDLVAVHALPPLHGLNGVAGFEPLADSCGIAWTMYGSRTVRVFDLCTDRARPDLFTIAEADGFPYLVRQLPGGEFLMATERRVLRVTAAGAPVATYDAAASFLALTPDGTGFWWIDARDSTLRRLDFAAPNEVFRLKSSFQANGLTVAGEWRASLQPLPPAPPSRRRSVQR